jgi:hypothetical protein
MISFKRKERGKTAEGDSMDERREDGFGLAPFYS